MIDNPCQWMFDWPKNVNFIGCYFEKGLVDPQKQVQTEYIYIRTKNNCQNIKINYEKFPKLKKVIIE
jgi:hypothetical protein